MSVSFNSFLQKAREVATESDESESKTSSVYPSRSYSNKEVEDIIKVQAIFRGKKAREEYLNALSYKEFSKSVTLLSNQRELFKLPTAMDGKVLVYLSSDPNTVLKETGTFKAVERWQKNQQAARLCRKNAFTSLLIPKSQVYGRFLIQERVPLNKYCLKSQVGLYMENPERFTRAVKELTSFLCQCTIPCITSKKTSYYSTLTESETHLLRYDNFRLILDEDRKGKIACIDLERFSEVPPEGFGGYLVVARKMISSFPLHFDEIVAIVEKHVSLRSKLPSLERKQRRSIRGFQKIYIDHAISLEERDITLENPTKSPKLSTLQKKKLQGEMEKKLQGEMDQSYEALKGILGNEQLLIFRKELFPQLVEAVENFIQKHLQNHYKIYQQGRKLEKSDLPSIRTLLFPSRKNVYYDLFEQFLSSPFLDKVQQRYKQLLLIQLGNMVFDFLSKENLIHQAFLSNVQHRVAMFF